MKHILLYAIKHGDGENYDVKDFYSTHLPYNLHWWKYRPFAVCAGRLHGFENFAWAVFTSWVLDRKSWIDARAFKARSSVSGDSGAWRNILLGRVDTLNFIIAMSWLMLEPSRQLLQSLHSRAWLVAAIHLCLKGWSKNLPSFAWCADKWRYIKNCTGILFVFIISQSTPSTISSSIIKRLWKTKHRPCCPPSVT